MDILSQSKNILFSSYLAWSFYSLMEVEYYKILFLDLLRWSFFPLTVKIVDFTGLFSNINSVFHSYSEFSLVLIYNLFWCISKILFAFIQALCICDHAWVCHFSSLLLFLIGLWYTKVLCWFHKMSWGVYSLFSRIVCVKLKISIIWMFNF